MKKYFLLVFIVFVVTVVIGCSRQKQTILREDAEKIASETLHKYCHRKGLSASQFPPPEVSSEPGVPWVFDYTSDGVPRRLLRITIDEYGAVELSHMTE